MDLFVAVNKPKGWTSFDVVNKARSIFKVKKAGHSGTLDPLASGVLIVALGKMTRLLRYMVSHTKSYEAVIELGKVSSSYDLETQAQTVGVSSIPLMSEVNKVLHRFEGKILQQPPPFSAIKVNGQRSYLLTRQNQTPVLHPRPVEISRLVCTRYEYPFLELEIDCGSGTYIRSLAHDIGQNLCTGGLLYRLTRSRVDTISLQRCVTVEELQTLPIAQTALSTQEILDMLGLPVVSVSEQQHKDLGYGKKIGIEPVCEDSRKIVCLFEGAIVAVGEVASRDNLLRPETVLL